MFDNPYLEFIAKVQPIYLAFEQKVVDGDISSETLSRYGSLWFIVNSAIFTYRRGLNAKINDYPYFQNQTWA